MASAMIIVRERDKETDTYAVLDMLKLEISQDPKSVKKMIGDYLTPFLMQVHDRHSDISDINIEFKRQGEGW